MNKSPLISLSLITILLATLALFILSDEEKTTQEKPIDGVKPNTYTNLNEIKEDISKHKFPIAYNKLEKLFADIPKFKHKEVSLDLLKHLTTYTQEITTTRAPKTKDEIKKIQNTKNYGIKVAGAEKIRSKLAEILVMSESFDPQNDLTSLIEWSIEKRSAAHLKLIEEIFADMGKTFVDNEDYIHYIGEYLDHSDFEIAFISLFSLGAYIKKDVLEEYRKLQNILHKLRDNLENRNMTFIIAKTEIQKEYYISQMKYYIDKLNKRITGELPIEDYSHQRLSY